MKKFLSIFLSIIVISFVSKEIFAAKVETEVFSLYDLSSVDIPSLLCNDKASAVLDGKISDDEYGSGACLSEGKGLASSVSKSGSLGQKIYVSTDHRYFYVGIEFDHTSQNDEGNPSGYYVYSHKVLKNVYAVSVLLGMSPGDHPSDRTSLFTNTYYFSLEDQSCVGVFGERICYLPQGGSEYAMCISSTAPMYQEEGCLAEDGIKWTAAEYMKNAAISISESENAFSFVAEFKIPVDDVLLSVSSDQRQEIKDLFRTGEGVLCGSFASKIGGRVGENGVVSGVLSNSTCPISQENETWKNYLEKQYSKESFPWIMGDIIPIPLYLNGEVPLNTEGEKESGGFDSNSKEENILENTKENVKEENIEEDGLSELKSEIANLEEKISSAQSSASSIKVPVSSSASSPKTTEVIAVPEETIIDSQDDAAEDESIFESLPEKGDLIPEDTVIVPLESSNKTGASDSQKENGSVLGQGILLASGILLFAAVIVVTVLLEQKEKKLLDKNSAEEKNGKNVKNSSSKKRKK